MIDFSNQWFQIAFNATLGVLWACLTFVAIFFIVAGVLTILLALFVGIFTGVRNAIRRNNRPWEK